MSTLSAKEYKCFEDIKRVRPDGSEYWAARELAPVLDYAKWENFYKVIKRAMIACENSGRSTLECFPEVRKTSPMPNGGVKDILDYELSRYACYLIVQNGDPRKEVIALGQTYFAIQTYRQEVADRFNQLDEDSRRLVVRGDIKQWNQLLAETARNAGVITAEEFAIFQNAGYMGLYGGMTVDDIHRRKGLAIGQKILDYMGSTELIAKLLWQIFRLRNLPACELKEPHFKHFSLERYSQMYELREKGKVLIRIVFTVQNEDIILLTSFIKRQPRDTMKALDQSLYILSDIQQHPDRTSNFDFQREATA